MDRLKQEIPGLNKPVKKAKGFKDIPMLNAIATRYGHMRTLSIDGMAMPPESETHRG